MRYLSVCSGIEAASVAWRSLDWQSVAFAEIDKFPCAVLGHHYPEVPNYGDITKFHDWPDTRFDVLVGGTPCQSFSVAGLRTGLADPRGNLALTYLAIADRYRPKWIVWENVPGILSSKRGRDFGTFLGALGQLGYGWVYRSLDAQYFGLAQRRKRVFVVGYIGNWRLAAEVLFDSESMSGNPAPRREAGEGFTHAIAPSIGASGRGFERAGETRGQDPVIAYGGNNTSGPIEVSTAVNAHGGPYGRLDFESETFIVNGTRRVEVSRVRRLTPRECERLQGFPDDYTLVPYRGKPAADGPRYKALGNSMAVPVVRWIGSRIDAVNRSLA